MATMVTAESLWAVWAQAPESSGTQAPGRTWRHGAAPKSAADVSGAYADAAEAVGWWVNLWGDSTNRTRLREAIRKGIDEAAQSLEWTSDGLLMEIVLLEQGHPESVIKVFGLLGDKVHPIALGSTPEMAYLRYMRGSAFRIGVPDGWSVNPYGTSYVWVTRNAQGRIASRVVPRGVVADLHRRVVDNYGRLAFEYERTSWDGRDRWERVAQATRKRLATEEARRKLDSMMKQIAESHERVRKANADLEKALEREARAMRTQTVLRTLKGVLTVAQLVDTAREYMQEPLSQLTSASSADAVLNVVETTANGARQQRVQMAAAFDGTIEDLRLVLKALDQKAAEVSAPSQVRDSLKLDVGKKN